MTASAGIPTGPGIPGWTPPATFLDRLVAVEGAFINVRHPDYGAVGDGIADDTAAIQTALDAVSSVYGGIVFVPAGRYRITATLNINRSKTRLFGAGKSSKLVDSSGTVAPMLKTNEVRDCFIDDLWFEGNGSTGIGVWLTQPNDGQGEADNYLSRCHIRFFGVCQVRLGNTDGTFGMGCHVTGCRIRATNPNNATGIENYGPDNTIKYNRIQADSGLSVLLDSKSSGGGGTQLVGNHIYSATANAAVVPLGVRLRGGNITLIQGNYFDNFRQGPCLTVDPPTGQACRDIDISSNIFLVAANFRNAANSADVDNQYPAIKIDTSSGGVVEGVLVRGNVGHAASVSSRWAFLLSMTAGTAGVSVRDNECRSVVAVTNVPAFSQSGNIIYGTGWTKPGEVFNVKDYAATGDGATDDSTAVAAAFTAASAAGGGKVFFPRGTYLWGGTPWVLADKVIAEGEGVGSTVIRIKAGVTVGQGVFQIVNRSGAEVRDLEIDLNKANITDPADDTKGQAVYFVASNATGITRCAVRRLYIHDGHRMGIYGTSSSASFPLEFEAIDCVVMGCGKRGLYAARPTRVRVSGGRYEANNVIDTGGGQIQGGVGGKNFELAGVTCIGGLGHGAAFSFVDGVRIVGGYFASNAKSGIAISEDCTNFLLHAIQATLNTEMGVTVDPKTAASETIKDTRGVISGLMSWSNTLHGLYVQYARGVSIAGATLHSNVGTGLYFVAAQRCVAEGVIALANAYGIRSGDSGTGTGGGPNTVRGRANGNTTANTQDTATTPSVFTVETT